MKGGFKLKETAVKIVLIMACGFIGGLAGTVFMGTQAASVQSRILRARQFDLITARGDVAAVLTSGEDGLARLAFKSADHKRDALTISVERSGEPSITLYNHMGTKVAVLGVHTEGDPFLGMGDEKMEGRVILGAFQEDLAGTRAGTWGLSFQSPDHSNPVLTLSVLKLLPTEKSSGQIVTFDREGRYWSAP